MNRPLYETDADLGNEEVFLHEVSMQWKLDYLKLPIKYQIDYAAFDKDGNLRSWVEVKVRTNASDAYPTYMISLDKVLAGLRLAEATGKPFVLLVRFLGNFQDMYCIFDPMDQLDVRWGGRKDRDDWQDSEPVVHIPMSHFKAVNK